MKAVITGIEGGKKMLDFFCATLRGTGSLFAPGASLFLRKMSCRSRR